MKKDKERALIALFRTYNKNKRELQEEYPAISGIDYARIKVTPDNSRNGQEEKTIAYISKREELFKKVFIVEETLNWFRLEGHGRERFIKLFMIRGCSWVKAEMELHISEATLFRWRKEVLEKAEMVSDWLK